MEEHFTNMRGLVNGFAVAMNLISPQTQNHHQQVAYLAYHIAKEMNFDEDERHQVIYGALLHDVGSVLVPDGTDSAGRQLSHAKIAQTGAKILDELPFLSGIAKILRASCLPWKTFSVHAANLTGIVIFGQIIHLADEVSMLLDTKQSVLNQVDKVCRFVQEYSGTEFHEEVVAAFLAVAKREYVWMNLLYEPEAYLKHINDHQSVSLDHTTELTKLASRIIDFRSPFTAMHSAGVAASAEALARLIGMSYEECKMMRIAGYLHDIGKLKIPREILEKKGKLTPEEFNVIKEHAYYTHLLLKNIEGFEQITMWAAYHHEKLNGTGYPFRFRAEDIPLGSRVLAVADVFSAITEERPYRSGMNRDEALQVLRENADAGALSPQLVELLATHYDRVEGVRAAEAKQAGRRYFESMKPDA